MRRIILFLIPLFSFVLLTQTSLWAQEETGCTAKAPSEVAVGRQFKYTVSTTAKGEVLSYDFGKFELVSGPNVGTSTSISVTNGTVEQNTSYTYTYYLVGNKEGSFNIPGVTISIDGRVVKSNPVAVSVVKTPKTQPENEQADNWFQFEMPNWSDFFSPRTMPEEQPKQKSKSDKTESDVRVNKEDFFVKATSASLEAYQGEAIVVTHKLYVREQKQGYSIERAVFEPTDAFWSNGLELKYRDEGTETVNGKTYSVYTIKQTAFYPTKTGKVTIPKMNLTLLVKVPTTRRDPFWGTYTTYKGQNISLTSNDIPVKVKSLPNAHSAKTEVVGNFTVSSSLNKTDVHANEPVVLTVTFSGTGNLHHISADDLQINFPADCDITYPKVTSNISAKGDVVTGSKTFKYTIIPRSEGTFLIPGASYQYYDYDSGSYKTISSQDYQITVSPARQQEYPSEKPDKGRKPAKTYKI